MSPVEIELDPEQPEPVVRAVEALLRDDEQPDPWWRAGMDDALGTR